MKLDNKTIELAVNGKYTEFSEIIKTALHDKVANNAKAQEYAKEFDKIQNMKAAFADIAKSTEE
jgi:5'-deoxynucleotidase YfbR-like HD superfamily hydrolase